jgi:hypothetical protein
MKTLIFILLILGFVSCNNETRIITTTTTGDSHYIVKEIRSASYRDGDNVQTDQVRCFYYLTSNKNLLYYINDIVLLDSIGKFKIGSSVYINPSLLK